jgi:ABC-type transport system involved in multi-copper enzyme maturation permease subunit
VAEEIEGRTALTVLSKPVSRRQFILGKFSGISMSVALMFLVLGLWFMIWVAYKPVYDGQESADKLTDWAQPFIESFNIAPGLFLCFLEIVIFVAISVAISTRMGILANFLICASIYVLGHLTPMIVQSSFAEFEPVVVFGQLVATVLPVLDHFDIQAAISRNTTVPIAYMAEMLLYTALYSAVAMLLSLVFFEDRDLA